MNIVNLLEDHIWSIKDIDNRIEAIKRGFYTQEEELTIKNLILLVNSDSYIPTMEELIKIKKYNSLIKEYEIKREISYKEIILLDKVLNIEKEAGYLILNKEKDIEEKFLKKEIEKEQYEDLLFKIKEKKEFISNSSDEEISLFILRNRVPDFFKEEITDALSDS